MPVLLADVSGDYSEQEGSSLKDLFRENTLTLPNVSALLMINMGVLLQSSNGFWYCSHVVSRSRLPGGRNVIKWHISA